MSVYTKFGDKGKTSLYGGKTVSKDDIRVEAYGAMDELNSFLGIVLAFLKDKSLSKKLILIQKDLFEVGASLANPSANKHKELSKYLLQRIKDFENEIDDLSKKLPELENFILPGGSISGSQLHFARTLVRRTERRVVALSKQEKINDQLLIFINRLSDLLFMYARIVNKKIGKKETIWKSRE